MNYKNINPLIAHIDQVNKLSKFIVGISYETEVTLKGIKHFNVIVPYCSLTSTIKQNSEVINYWDIQEEIRENDCLLTGISTRDQKVVCTFYLSGKDIEVVGDTITESMFRMYLFMKTMINEDTFSLSFEHSHPFTSSIDDVKKYARLALDLTYEKEIYIRGNLYQNVILPYCSTTSQIKQNNQPVYYWDLNPLFQKEGFFLQSAIRQGQYMYTIYKNDDHIFEVVGESMEEIAYRLLMFIRVRDQLPISNVDLADNLSKDEEAA